jgi:hypothetical protein
VIKELDRDGFHSTVTRDINIHIYRDRERERERESEREREREREAHLHIQIALYGRHPRLAHFIALLRLPAVLLQPIRRAVDCQLCTWTPCACQDRRTDRQAGRSS